MMTFNLWQKKSQEDMLRKMNSEKSIWNTKKEQQLANKEVSIELKNETTVSKTQMSNILDKMLEEKLAKKSKQIRKIYLADLKNSQKSTATNNGSKKNILPSALKKSSKSSPRQQQQQHQPRQQFQQSQRTSKKVRFQEAHQETTSHGDHTNQRNQSSNNQKNRSSNNQKSPNRGRSPNRTRSPNRRTSPNERQNLISNRNTNQNNTANQGGLPR